MSDTGGWCNLLQALCVGERAARVFSHADAQMRQAEAELTCELGIHGWACQHGRAHLQVDQRPDKVSLPADNPCSCTAWQDGTDSLQL
jgi:hypothetical protein